ncbi:putative sterol transport protein NPC2 [Helianthus annuus]|uniref:Putative MD-2-related lipid recognition domain-containing protein / ML domain-containing protein n=1 Tax=Helianthus annuus TaxID=4232 RepID=A0A251SQK5_HELAN|nr:putative phosphatidylglycerol/phosphatidylinositol transfer protein DDB_G0282179 [Helianthus annuus]KAF5772933.1 putative sterol transport protein NPC2 [Helianthus annuus]KAJ0476486.1 putative sterol transport protein NPC2 [Helianthus annuus]KAJ0480699.1 putative sterol transport protein NPC2 [Helianthus annuus]KAJ0497313.1 putative sterol transport protein NPC2 [Helianthus annuus]KAJ0663321.1 putative sterol transport protein NPC2 [Helianthus annuus]
MAGFQSNLFIVFLCSLSLIAPFAHAIDVKYCKKNKDYDVKVSGVDITPYPIERGVETTFTISASTETPISGGNLVIDVSYYWFGVYSETSDLCTKTTCPVTTGDFAISHSQSLPSVTPPGSYTLTMKLQDGNKNELTCITFDFSIGWYISEEAVASS